MTLWAQAELIRWSLAIACWPMIGGGLLVEVCGMNKFTREDFERLAQQEDAVEAALFSYSVRGMVPKVPWDGETRRAAKTISAALRIAVRAMDRERIARLVTDEGNPGGDVGPYQYAFADAIIAYLTEEAGK